MRSPLSAYIRQRLAARFADPLLRTAYPIMAATVLTAGLGVIFWIVAARTYPRAVVGRDTAVVTSFTALSVISQLNMLVAIERFLPRAGARTARGLALAYGLTTAAGVVFSALFVFLAPMVAPEVGFVRDDPIMTVLFIVAVPVWGVFVLQDAALTALRSAFVLPIENGIFSLVKVAVLPLMVVVWPSHGIFASWLLPAVLLIPVINWLLFRRIIPRHVAQLDPAVTGLSGFTRRQLVTMLAHDYLGTILSMAALVLLPVVVLSTLGARESAYFGIAFALVTAFDMLLLNSVTSLVVQASYTGEDLGGITRSVLRRLFLPLGIASGLLVVAAPAVLLPFGDEYRENATTLVRLLACASLPRGLMLLAAGLCRIRGYAWPLIAWPAANLVLVIGLTLLLAPPLGPPGVGVAWLGASLLLGAASVPLIVLLLRREPAPGNALTSLAGDKFTVLRSLAASYPEAPTRVSITRLRLAILVTAVLATVGVEIIVATGHDLIGQFAAAGLIALLVFERPSPPAPVPTRAKIRLRHALRALALVPLAQIVSMGFDGVDVSASVAMLAISVIVFVGVVSLATFVDLRIGGFAPLRMFSVTGALVLSYPLGFAAYLAGAPELVSSRTGGPLVALAVVALAAAAATEELLFRGVLQMSLQRVAGRLGVLVAGAVSAATYLGTGSAALVLTMLVAGLVFANAVMRTGTTGSVVLAHAILAVTASVFWPIVLGPRDESWISEPALLAALVVAALLALAAVLRGRGAGLDVLRTERARREAFR